MAISGRTGLIFIIGHPVAQVKTPPSVNEWCRKAGLDVVMVPLDVPPGQLGQLFDLVRASETVVGLSLTYPHKQAALALTDDVSARCRRIGAVNTIRREPDGHLVGEMTDGLAMRAALEGAGVDLTGASALLAGAGGGAGAAIADALCEAGVARLLLSEPDEDRLSRITESLTADFPSIEVVRDDGTTPVDIGVNASPLGLRPSDPEPFDLQRIARGGAVADVVTPDEPSRLVRRWRAKGAPVVSGDDMAEAQLSFQLDHWQVRGSAQPPRSALT